MAQRELLLTLHRRKPQTQHDSVLYFEGLVSEGSSYTRTAEMVEGVIPRRRRRHHRHFTITYSNKITKVVVEVFA